MRIISGKARGTKLFTLEGLNTRPTLDRVKESMFNIIASEIHDSIVLDLFAGSGAIGLEFISRGAKKAYLCDNSKDAISIINKNVEKTHFQAEAHILNCDYLQAINSLSENIGIVYIDPPYKTDYIKKSLEKLISSKYITDETLIIAETDEYERVLNEIKNLELKTIDTRQYGRANLIFFKINRKE